MIHCDVTPEHIAAHYDDLDTLYRRIWGEHLHHGLWRSRSDDTSTAVRALARLVAEKSLASGARICDVGCGYGAVSQMLARDFQASVTAVTISKKQYRHAVTESAGSNNPLFLLRDWSANQLPAGSFDAVIAIESLAHMSDKRAFFLEASRVLRPGGRLVVCTWLTRSNPRPWEVRYLLRPICHEGCLPSMGSADEYRLLMRGTGVVLREFEDLSRQVRKTWSVCIGRVLKCLLADRDLRRFLCDRRQPNRIFGLAILRIWLAYRTGSMQYGMFVAEKSAG